MKNKKLLLTLALAGMFLSACGPTSNPPASTTPGGDATDTGQATTPSGNTDETDSSTDTGGQPVDAGFVIPDYEEPFEIHTDEQKTYLEYDGDYSAIPESSYPDGKNHISDSLPVHLEWEYNAPEGTKVKSYSVTFGRQADLSDGYEVKGSSKASIDLINPWLGVNYFRVSAKLDDSSVEESEIKTFLVDETAPRNLTIDGMTNCRDMGGRATVNGGKVKQGLVYRTSGNRYDYSTTISNAGTKEMLEHLQVKTEVNVADGTSYNVNLAGTNVVNLLMDYDQSGANSSHHFSRNAENVKNWIKLLADSSNYPVYFHCRIGTDRTGLCAIILYGLLGVELNDIYQDYLFSNFGKIQEKRYIGSKAGQDNIQNYISQINAFPGESFHNKVYNVLLSIGVPAATLDTVIANLTEGTPAQGNNAGQFVAFGDDLVASGVNKKTNNDRNHPATYYTLNSTSASVSASFNAAEAFDGTVVAYLGNMDHSSSKKIGDAITCEIDSTALSINDITYSDAGMGKCGNRMNYFPVILGTSSFSAGDHTIKIVGTANTMNIASICVFGGQAGSSSGGGQGGEQGEHTHSFSPESPQTNTAGKSVTTYLCDCGAKYLAIAFNDYSSVTTGSNSETVDASGKLGKGAIFKWDFPAKAGRVSLQFNLKLSSSSDSHFTHVFDPSTYVVKVNGAAIDLSVASGKTYRELGLTNTTGTYLDFASFDIDADKNVEIELDHNNTEYRLLFTEQVRLVYA